MLNMDKEQLSIVFPITGAVIYKRALLLRRAFVGEEKFKKANGTRQMIDHLSKRSLSNLVLKVGSSNIMWLSMITLTYGPNYPIDGKLAKEHLHKFLVFLARRYPNLEYCWFLEFQKRGAPHYHILTTVGPVEATDRMIMASYWSRLIEPENFPYCQIKASKGKIQQGRVLNTRDSTYKAHVHEKAWENARTMDGCIRYLMKYACKPRQKKVPLEYRNVGRFWGVSSGVQPVEIDVVHGNEALFREFLAMVRPNMANVGFLPKIIYLPDDFDKLLKKK